MLLIAIDGGFEFADAYRGVSPVPPAFHNYVKRNVLYGLCFATGNVPMIGIMRALSDSNLDGVLDSGLTDLLVG